MNQQVRNLGFFFGLTVLISTFSINVQAQDDNPWGKPEEKAAAEKAPEKKVVAKAPVKKPVKKVLPKIVNKPVVAHPILAHDVVEKVAPVTAPATPVAKSAAKDEAERTLASESALSKTVELSLTTDSGCYNVEFENMPGAMPACSELLPIIYTKRNCTDQKFIEKAEVKAIVDCADKRKITLRFRSSDAVISTTLIVGRDAKTGRQGNQARFTVQDVNADQKPTNVYVKLLPQPEMKPQVESKPEESPLKFKASGYAAIEFERLNGFGFAGVNSLPNMPVAVQGSRLFQNFNLLSNVNIDVSRDQTTLSTVLEVGEVYFGDYTTGGARYIPGGEQQDRRAIIELRNFFLTHEFTDRVNVQGGIMALSSDPRAFIFSDHLPGFKVNYKDDQYELNLMYAIGQRKRQGVDYSKATNALFANHEWVTGVQFVSISPSKVKSTLYGTVYGVDSQDVVLSDGLTHEKAQLSSYWLGGTFDFGEQNAFNAQLSLIGNWSNTQAQTEKHEYFSYLINGKMNFLWEAPNVNFGLEGLLTPGSSSSALGSKKSFQSTTGAHYMYTIAGSDGWDDAVGSARDYIIAPTNLTEGLIATALTISPSLSKKFTSLFRFGTMETVAKQAATGSKHFGEEADAEFTFQLSPSTNLQMDYARFFPGAYFGNSVSAVDSATTRVKFAF